MGRAIKAAETPPSPRFTGIKTGTPARTRARASHALAETETQTNAPLQAGLFSRDVFKSHLIVRNAESKQLFCFIYRGCCKMRR